MILHHGTDWRSALSILNEGLDVAALRSLQARRESQLGVGWYTTESRDIAWFFASMAPGNSGGGYTVLAMELAQSDLHELLVQKLAVQSEIVNVPFQGRQYWFAPASFPFLNERAVFRPLRQEE